jgi:hypothetical protein
VRDIVDVLRHLHAPQLRVTILRKSNHNGSELNGSSASLDLDSSPASVDSAQVLHALVVHRQPLHRKNMTARLPATAGGYRFRADCTRHTRANN